MTCADNATACQSDTDCGVNNGPCSHKCIVTGCADEIYIGHLSNCPGGNTTCACSKDSDCPDGTPGQCDIGAGATTSGTCGAPVQLENVYDFATNNYIAAGGSGFRVLQRNTTQIDSKIQQRDALVDYIRNGHACGYDPNQTTDNGLVACSTDADCTSAGDFVCACPGQVNATGTDTNQTCDSSSANCNGQGSCVLRTCRDQVATFHEKLCTGSPNLSACDTDLDACSLAGEECKVLPCVDTSLGAATDNRILMTGR
jgi:5'-nucleotidase